MAKKWYAIVKTTATVRVPIESYEELTEVQVRRQLQHVSYADTASWAAEVISARVETDASKLECVEETDNTEE